MPIAFKAPSLPLLSPSRAVHVMGGAVLLATLYLWSERFRPPAPPMVVEIASPTISPDAAAQTLAAWVGPGEVRMNIQVLGVMIRNGHAVALLKINDVPPRAVMVGDALTGNVVVERIEPDAVTVATRQGALRFPAPHPPKSSTTGLVVRSR